MDSITTHAQYESAILETVGSRHYLRLNGDSWKLSDYQLSELLHELTPCNNPLSAAKILLDLPKEKYQKVTV